MREEFFDGVLRPLMAMFGVQEVHPHEMTSLNDPLWNPPYNLSFSVGCWRAGQPLPAFSPSDEAMAWAKQYDGCVTVTLRESRDFPERNSHTVAWVRFAQEKLERVVFVRDTIEANTPLPYGLEICPEASLDLQKRCALYRVARQNMGVANGPFTLCTATDSTPYVMFETPQARRQFEMCHRNFFVIEPPMRGDRSTFWALWKGYDWGEQVPWATKYQRVVYAADSYVNINQAYDLAGQRTETARPTQASRRPLDVICTAPPRSFDFAYMLLNVAMLRDRHGYDGIRLCLPPGGDQVNVLATLQGLGRIAHVKIKEGEDCIGSISYVEPITSDNPWMPFARATVNRVMPP